MTQKKLSTFVLVLFLLLALAQASQGDISVNVPLHHWGYGYIERFEARGVLRNLGDGIKPLSRLAMARALLAIVAAAEKGFDLSQTEKGELLLLKEEFSSELSQIGKGKMLLELPV